MARPRSPTPRSEQVNVRLTSEQAELLTVVAFLNEVGPSEYLRQLFLDQADQLSANPSVQDVLRARAEFQAQEAGTLKHIRGTESAS